MKMILAYQTFITRFLPILILLCAIVAYAFPGVFRFLQEIPAYCLAFILFTMGLTLKTESLVQVMKQPKSILWGMSIKWSINLVVSLIIAFSFLQFSRELAVGILLAGTVPSGTAANLYTFMAQGHVALSITMSTLDTLIAPLLTPGLVKVVFGQIVPIPFFGLFIRLILIVLLPIALGLYLQTRLKERVQHVRTVIPLFSSSALLIIVLAVISSAQPILLQNIELLPLLGFALFLQVAIPFVAGYFISKKVGLGEEESRAILFQTGICNTALAAILAMEVISPLAAVPAVINMVINLSLGALAANYFSRKVKVAGLKQT
jgi:BASS family bile acid:Na+ symporter